MRGSYKSEGQSPSSLDVLTFHVYYSRALDAMEEAYKAKQAALEAKVATKLANLSEFVEERARNAVRTALRA